MKKLIFSIVVSSLIATSAMAAYIGKVSNVVTYQNGKVLVSILNTSNSTEYTKVLDDSSNAGKAMLALALTAQTSESDVVAAAATINGVSAWRYIKIK